MCAPYGVAFLAFLAGAAAQDEATFAGFATKADCKATPCGGYGHTLKCCLALSSSKGSCPCSEYYNPPDIPNATNSTWARIDWPLDDVCDQKYPGSKAATMPQLTSGKIANLPMNISSPDLPHNGSAAWVVPGCLGAHEGQWPNLPGTGRTWFCAQYTSGAYRWALPPGSNLHNVTIGDGWLASAVNSTTGGACTKPYTSTCSKPYYEGDKVGSFVCADEHRELPGAITAVCVTGGGPGPSPSPPAPPGPPSPTPPAPPGPPSPTPPAPPGPSPTPGPPVLYACNGTTHTCAASSTGSFNTSTCDNKCGAPLPPVPPPGPPHHAVSCNPDAPIPEMCPGNKPCPKCGKQSCPCPNATWYYTGENDVEVGARAVEI